MFQKIQANTHRLGAILYALWGVLHIFAAYNVYVLGASQAPTVVQGRLYQGAWNLLFIAILSVVIAVMFNWRNSHFGYWLNLWAISITDIGFIGLLLLPGYSTELLGPIVWILGAIFTTLGFLTNPRTP